MRKLLYETEIKLFQFFIAALSCFYIIPIYLQTIYWNITKDKFYYFLGLTFMILAIIQFFYMLKKFEIYQDCLIVKRPYFIKSYNHIFQKDDIERIVFRISSTKIGGGINLVVHQKKLITSFQVILNQKSLIELVENLRLAKIEVEVAKNIKL